MLLETLQQVLKAGHSNVQALIEDVQRLQSTLAQLRESSTKQLARFEEELQVRSRHIQRLEAQLENQKDYQEIRRELRWATPSIFTKFVLRTFLGFCLLGRDRSGSSCFVSSPNAPQSTSADRQHH